MKIEENEMASNQIGPRAILGRVRSRLPETVEPSIGMTFHALREVVNESGKTCRITLTGSSGKVIHQGFIKPYDEWLNLTHMHGVYATVSVIPDRIAGLDPHREDHHPRDAAALTLLNGFRSRVKGKDVNGLKLSVV